MTNSQIQGIVLSIPLPRTLRTLPYILFFILHANVPKRYDLVHHELHTRQSPGMTNSLAHRHHHHPLPLPLSHPNRMPRKIPDPEAAADSAWKYRQKNREAVNQRARLRMREKRERLKDAPSAVQLEYSVRAALHRQNYLQRTKKAVQKPRLKLTPKKSPAKKLPRQEDSHQAKSSSSKRPLPGNVMTDPLPPVLPRPTVSKHFTVPRHNGMFTFAPRSPPPHFNDLPRARTPDSPTPLPRKPIAEIEPDSDDPDSFAPRLLSKLPLRARNSPAPLSLAEIDAADSDDWNSDGGWDGDNESDS
ncbi:hypothetical protein DFH06DRAFT_1347127 [Mycena polygramma]|nr:hypothetical protein DFH06DRAFT_1347127 [Mycena polygramma]